MRENEWSSKYIKERSKGDEGGIVRLPRGGGFCVDKRLSEGARREVKKKGKVKEESL